ncbi:CHAT domain-containing protein [Apiospora arundinis]
MSSLLRLGQWWPTTHPASTVSIPSTISGESLYAPLDPTASEVRLLKLLPGNFDEAIHCELEARSLDHKPRYEALSYVWGDASVKRPVYVNGRLFQATSSLETTLRYLRHSGKPRILWVDAICINQADDAEKSTQVPLMAKIYTQCSQTVAWLGLPTPEMMPVISLMSPRLSVRYLREKGLLIYVNILAFASIDGSMRRSIFYRKLGLATLIVSQFSYWSRIWTYQEFWLSKRVTFVCGDLAFEPLLRSRRREARMIIRNAWMTPEHPHNASAALSAEWDQLQAAFDQQFVDHGLQNGFIYELYSATGAPPSPADAFPLLLQRTAGRQCTNRRDRIYGLYAFSPLLQRVYPVDYKKPSWDVMHDTTAASVQESGTILYASFARHCFQPSRVPIPTWVLDYAAPFIAGTKVPMLLVPEGTESHPEPRASFMDRATLRLPAHRMGRCCSSTLQLSWDHAELAGELLRLLELQDEIHTRIRMALVEFIDIDKITSNLTLLRDMLEYFSCSSSGARREWGISPEFFEKSVLRPLAGKSVALFNVEALSATEPESSSMKACLVSGQVAENDLIVLPACDGVVMALRRELQHEGDSPLSDPDASYFNMAGVAWVEGMSGMNKDDIAPSGKRLLAAVRGTQSTDFFIH